MTQSFQGIRILDFTQVFAGPFGVMQLALLGAEVIKIEQPDTGDQTRGLMNASNEQGMSPAFSTMNLNKQSLTLNLKHQKAVSIVKSLVRSSDVIVENFKAGTMTKLGLDYDALKQIKPDLIYCSITGYGQTGPKAGEAAYDGAIQAASGMMSQNGHEDTGPTRTGYMPVDMATALNSAFAIASALHRRERFGTGQHIDISMLDTAILLQASQFSNYLNQGQLLGLLGNASPTRAPTADVFATQDGVIQITALKQNQVSQLFDALDCASALEDPKFESPAARITHSREVQALLSREIKKQTTEYWMQRLPRRGVPTAEVKSIPEAAKDPQLAFREILETWPPTASDISSKQLVKAAYLTDQDGPKITSSAPTLGEHNERILDALGYSESAIAELRADGVIS